MKTATHSGDAYVRVVAEGRVLGRQDGVSYRVIMRLGGGYIITCVKL